MKKVLANASGIVFAVFGVAILGLLMSLTYSALQRLFPGNFANQIWGLVMFDIAAMCWALAFVFKSETTGQYAAAAIGFATGFIGTLGMVAAEVILASGTAKDPTQIAQWMTYGFIIVTVIHAALLYFHHAAAPDIHEKINVGVARGEIVTEAIKQATSTLEVQKAELALNIHHEIVSQVKRDLGLMPTDGTPFDRKHSDTQMLLPPALPCGHTDGATWNRTKETYECSVCHKPFKLEDLVTSDEKPAVWVPEDVYRDLQARFPNKPGKFIPAKKDEAHQPQSPFRPE